MLMQKIAIIGAGNLGTALAKGLLQTEFLKPENLTLTKRNLTSLEEFKQQGVHISADNSLAVKNSTILIVSLKPYNVKEVLENLRSSIDPSKHIVVSLVTGITLKELSGSLPPNVALIRAMPNTALAIQESVTCLSSSNATAEQLNLITELFKKVGITINLDEKLMDAATVLGACGVAYALRFIRAATQGGIEIGFDAKTASLIAAQTVKGAAELLLKGKKHPEEEIDKVTTPKGCTIVGLNEMEHRGFSSSLIRGISASYQKINS